MRRHLKLASPAAVFAFFFIVLGMTDLDRSIARTFFFDATTQHWIGAQTWWATDLIHTGGRDLMRLIAGLALGTFIASGFHVRSVPWRRAALFVFLAIGISSAVAGTLKHLTNVDCPWDLQSFGGHRPYVGLLANRADDLPRAACFPGAHSASGFSLLCFYFVLRERSRRAAIAALAAAIGVGVLFSWGQQARGAHFLSHDLTSAILVWYILLALYALMTRRRPLVDWRRQNIHSTPSEGTSGNQ